MDRPILFSAPMVRALLDGRKTMTRRLAWGSPSFVGDRLIEPGEHITTADLGNTPVPLTHRPSLWQRVEPGDRLWVREAFQIPALCPVQYRATATERIGHWDPKAGPWKPSIHMPRWASRLTLTVTAKRIERLQQIAEDDARAEGCPVTWDGKPYDPPPPEVDSWQGYGRYSFCLLWQKLHGKDSWGANPDVVALRFTVERRNIDVREDEKERAR